MPRRSRAGLPLLLLFLLVGCGGADAPAPELQLSGRTMGTSWSVRVAAPPETLREAELQARIEDRLAAINALMSTWDPASQLSRFNRAAPGDWFPVDAELVTVLAAAREIAEASDGAFDVTVGPLVDLWGFGAGAEVEADAVPSPEAIEAARARVGYTRLELREAPPALRKTAPLEVDLSSIAKGYAVDALAALVKEAGAERFLAEIGGELRAEGENARGVPWRIGIEVPDPTRRGVAREAIGLSGTAVATSGDYRNFFTVDGTRYSHTIDPATGRPVVHRVASVTVLHPEAMWADGWATALNVLGAERGLAVADEQGLAVSFILYDEDGGLAERGNAAFERHRNGTSP